MHAGFPCGEYSLKHLPSRYLPFPDKAYHAIVGNLNKAVEGFRGDACR